MYECVCVAVSMCGCASVGVRLFMLITMYMYMYMYRVFNVTSIPSCLGDEKEFAKYHGLYI